MSSDKKFSIDDILQYNTEFVKDIISSVYQDQLEDLINKYKDSNVSMKRISEEAKENTENCIGVIFSDLKTLILAVLDSAKYNITITENSEVDVVVDW